MSYSPQIQDALQLLNTTVNTTGAGTAMDTTGYSFIAIQITGSSWNGNIAVEGSNDNTNWSPLNIVSSNEPTLIDHITENGNYIVNSTARYIRLNPSLLVGTFTVVAIGRVNNTDITSQIVAGGFDRNSNTPMYVQDTATRRDASGAIFLADEAGPFSGSMGTSGTTGVNGNLVFQTITTNYKTLVVSASGTWTGSAQIAVWVSIDGSNWVSTTGYQVSASGTGAQTSGIYANGIWVFSCIGKYIRLTYGNVCATGTMNVVAYLKSADILAIMGQISVDFVAVNGANAQGYGMPVMGGAAPGAAPVYQPVGIAGVDSSGLTRRILTDTKGDIGTAFTDQAGVVRPIGGLSPAGTMQNIGAIAVTDQTQLEGQTQIEILNQILIELRTNNQLLHQIGMGASIPDEPTIIRQDITLINNN